LQLLREIAASEAGLPATLAGRVSGESIGELRKDAKQLALDLGYASPQPRTPSGQYASFSDQLRAAAGRPVQPAEQPPQGDIGVGRGGAAIPRQPQPADMSSLIRAAAGIRSSAVHDLAEQLASEGHGA
jgi:hypothetical protein